MRALHSKLPNIRLLSKFLFGNSKTLNTVPAEFSPIPEPRHYGRDQATNPKDDRFSFTT
ncbi:8078_t:CDS:1, partial [Funneliformis caledonium]